MEGRSLCDELLGSYAQSLHSKTRGKEQSQLSLTRPPSRPPLSTFRGDLRITKDRNSTHSSELRSPYHRSGSNDLFTSSVARLDFIPELPPEERSFTSIQRFPPGPILTVVSKTGAPKGGPPGMRKSARKHGFVSGVSIPAPKRCSIHTFGDYIRLRWTASRADSSTD